MKFVVVTISILTCIVSLEYATQRTKEIQLILMSVHSKFFEHSIHRSDDEISTVHQHQHRRRNSTATKSKIEKGNNKKKHKKKKKKKKKIVVPDRNITNADSGHHLLNKTCIMDQIFEEGPCSVRSVGRVCMFPKSVIKQVSSNRSSEERKQKLYDNEIKMFSILNDTRYFPKLIDRDDACRTLVIENVQSPSVKYKGNNYSEGFGYYKKFYTSVFKIFNAHHIWPKDLNVCCNTIIRGEQIRIIDMALYQIIPDSEELHGKNQEHLQNILKELKVELDYAQGK